MLVNDFTHDPNRPPASSHSIVNQSRFVSGILLQSREKRVMGCRVASQKQLAAAGRVFVKGAP